MPAERKAYIPPLSEEKKEKLDTLFQKLLSQSQSVNSGKVKFINLEKVREHMGPVKWKRLQPIIHSIAQDAIQKHIDIMDIYFPFKEDDYLIIFARSVPEINDLKCKLIAIEIKNLIFEQSKIHAELKDIDLQCVMIETSIPQSASAENILEKLNESLDEKISREITRHPDQIIKDAAETVFIEVPEQKKEGQAEIHSFIEKKQVLSYSYCPLLDPRKGTYNTLVCIGNKMDAESSGSPIRDYNIIFEDADHNLTAAYDCQVLNHTIKTLKDPRYKNRFFMSCPVHFSTLNSSAFNNKYKHILAGLKSSDSKQLSFIVLDTPDDVTMPTLRYIVPSLKQYSYAVTLVISLKTRMSFSDYVNCWVDGLSLYILDCSPAEEQIYEGNLEKFVLKARSLDLKASLILNKPSRRIYEAAVKANFDFLGGEAICKTLSSPAQLLQPQQQSVKTG